MRGQPGVLCFALHSLIASLNKVPSPQGLNAMFALDKFCIRPSLCIQAWEKIVKLSRNIIKKSWYVKANIAGRADFPSAFTGGRGEVCLVG